MLSVRFVVARMPIVSKYPESGFRLELRLELRDDGGAYVGSVFTKDREFPVVFPFSSNGDWSEPLANMLERSPGLEKGRFDRALAIVRTVVKPLGSGETLSGLPRKIVRWRADV